MRALLALLIGATLLFASAVESLAQTAPPPAKRPQTAAPAKATTRPASAKIDPDSPAALMDEAFVAAQHAQTTAAGRALAQMSARFAAGTDALAHLVRKRQDLADQIRQTDDAWQSALSNTTAAEALRAKSRQLAAEITALDTQLNKDFPAYLELTSPKPLAIADVQKLLRPDEVLVVTFVTAQDSYVWAVNTTAAGWTRVAWPAAELDRRIRAIRANMAPGAEARGGESVYGADVAAGQLAFDRTAAYEIWQNFFAPLDRIVAGKSTLYLVASGGLASIPPALLVTAPPTGDDTDPKALQQTEWLAKRQATAILPSVTSLRALRAFKRADAGLERQPFIGFGAPTLDGRAGPGSRGRVRNGTLAGLYRGRLADPDAVRQLDSLPETEGELRRLASFLKAGPEAVRVGQQATEQDVKSTNFSAVKVIAFATHGLIAGDLSGLAEPALVFTPPKEASPGDDGLLTASEAARLKIQADWVILSACNTAAGDGKPGAEGLSGLARAFFFAGAQTLLVSHWPVNDEAAARLTTGAIGVQQGDAQIGRAEALRRSSLDLMMQPEMTFAHPVMWAPFIVVGEGN